MSTAGTTGLPRDSDLHPVLKRRSLVYLLLFPCNNNAAQPRLLSGRGHSAVLKLLLSQTWPQAWEHQRRKTDELFIAGQTKRCLSAPDWSTHRAITWPPGYLLRLWLLLQKFTLRAKLLSVILMWSYSNTNTLHSHENIQYTWCVPWRCADP